MKSHPFEHLLQQYNQELHGNLLPFWIRNGIDRANGGYFTCFSNDGSSLLSHQKFTWSQGRFVWMMARLYRSLEYSRPEKERREYLDLARSGAEFLMRHARLEDGSCAFILDEKGEPVLPGPDGGARKAGPGESYDLSIYADTFVIYGLGEFARASGERAALDFALDLYGHVKRRFDSGIFRSEPYPVPAGYKVHGHPMIMLETSQELAGCAESFGLAAEVASLRKNAADYCTEIMTHFRRPDEGVILEMLGTDNNPRPDLLGRYICPGHIIEDMWFVMHQALRTDNRALLSEAAETLHWALEKGWDSQYGGIPQFLDKSGRAPEGDVPPELEGHEMVKKLRGGWSNKLWWVHSEALYALLLAYEQLGEPWMDEWYARVHDYTFSTFPNPDRLVGEWIQIRDRQGRPENRIVALPVKDPFHIVRAFVLAIPVLERLAAKGW